MATHTHTTRRAVLKAAPAVVATVAALPAVALSDDPAGILETAAPVPSPLRALYVEWQETKTAYNTDDRYIGYSEEAQSKFDHLLEIERQVAEYVPQSVEDFAWKIIVADDDGQMNDNTAQHALVDMAYRMVGVTPGRWFVRESWG